MVFQVWFHICIVGASRLQRNVFSTNIFFKAICLLNLYSLNARLHYTQRSFASFKGQTYSSHDITMIIWFDIYTSIYRFVCVIVRFYFACLLSIQSLSCHLLRPYGKVVSVLFIILCIFPLSWFVSTTSLPVSDNAIVSETIMLPIKKNSDP